jgi:hypothetical protein
LEPILLPDAAFFWPENGAKNEFLKNCTDFRSENFVLRVPIEGRNQFQACYKNQKISTHGSTRLLAITA